MTRIVSVDVVDLRFPTSLSLDGSDAMNKDADYSAAYVVLRTDELGTVALSIGGEQPGEVRVWSERVGAPP